MSAEIRIPLEIGNAIPHGNASDTQQIISLWQHVAQRFNAQDFGACGGIGEDLQRYSVSLDASELLQLMQSAAKHAGSFNDYRKARVRDAGLSVTATLQLAISTASGSLEDREAHEVATIFLQQMVLACNIVLPGSIQMLDAHFRGEGSHKFEVQDYDSRILYGSLRTMRDNGWPALPDADFGQVWSWLEKTESSQFHTAVKGINKGLFTLLKVAEQRQEYSARVVLMVLYHLELLLDCRNAGSQRPARRRAAMILGDIPEQADCFRELYTVRSSLLLGDQPVHRPPLLSHDMKETMAEQLGQHNSAVEAGLAIVLALLHKLIAHDSQAFSFTESCKYE